MKKTRRFLAAIALAAPLSGPSLFGLGSAAMTHAAASRHASFASASFVVGTLVRSEAFKPYGPCPTGGGNDC